MAQHRSARVGTPREMHTRTAWEPRRVTGLPVRARWLQVGEPRPTRRRRGSCCHWAPVTQVSPGPAPPAPLLVPQLAPPSAPLCVLLGKTTDLQGFPGCARCLAFEGLGKFRLHA